MNLLRLWTPGIPPPIRAVRPLAVDAIVVALQHFDMSGDYYDRQRPYQQAHVPSCVENGYSSPETSSWSAPVYSPPLYGRPDPTVSWWYNASCPYQQQTRLSRTPPSSPENLTPNSTISSPRHPRVQYTRRYDCRRLMDTAGPAPVSGYQPTASPQITRHSWDDDIDELSILILGQTGVGKSSFINQFLQPDHRAGAPGTAEIGHSLLSCTKGVNEYSCIADNGRRLTLIDTPGFDDTYRSDAEVLMSIANYLASHFHSGRYMHGVIFLHRITDIRLSASAIKMAEIVKRICGKEFYTRVALVTNMWQLLTSKEVGYQREQELLNHPKFWADFREASAPHFQHSKTKESASKILEGFIRHLKCAPTRHPPLKIQIEIAQDGRPISETDAGDFLEGELVRMKQKHQRAMQQIKHDIQIAMQESDSDTAELLSESYDSTKFQLQQADRDIQILRRKDDDFIRDTVTRTWTDPSNLASRRNIQFATPSITDSKGESEGYKYLSDAESMPMHQPPQFNHFQEPESLVGQQRTRYNVVDPIPARSLSPKKAPDRKAERDASLGVRSGGGKPKSTKSSSRSSSKNDEGLSGVSAWMYRSLTAPRRLSMTAHGPLRQDGVRSRSAHA